MGYGDFKDLPGRTASHKVLRDKAFNIARNPKYDRCQSGLASMVYKFFNKKLFSANTSASRALSETLSTQNKFVCEAFKVEFCQISVFWT